MCLKNLIFSFTFDVFNDRSKTVFNRNLIIFIKIVCQINLY